MGSKSVKTKLHMKTKVNIYMCYIGNLARIFGKYVLHCNGSDPFVTLMGCFKWGPISCKAIISTLDSLRKLGFKCLKTWQDNLSM